MNDVAVRIHVVDTRIMSLLIAGEWIRVRDVVVSYADYTATLPDGTRTVAGHGLHVAATVDAGPMNGDRIVCPLGRVDGVRMTP